MAQTRFFQHLNENDTDFQKVTTLEYVDNSDDFTMYYFKDGSKCNKRFIAPVNANTIQGFEFAEVSDPKNVWRLKIVQPKIDKPKAMKADNGEWFEAPDISDFLQNGKTPKPRIDVIKKPYPIKDYVIPDDNEYLYDAIKFDFNDEKSNNDVSAEVAQFTEINDNTASKKQKIEAVTNTPQKITEIVDETGEYYHIYINQILNSGKIILHYPDGKTFEMDPVEFIENAITPKEEKIVEKVVEKEVVVKTSDTDIDLGIDNVQKGLLDNMIDMSNKMECAIDMELTLKLPPASVYKLIKSVYPSGMDRGFVNIIANRMQVKELKNSVADGLMSFYDDEYINESNNEILEEHETPKKPGRKKQTV